MKLDELPMYIPCDEQDEFSIVSLYDKNRSYGLIGINIFTIYLYEKMKQTKQLFIWQYMVKYILI